MRLFLFSVVLTSIFSSQAVAISAGEYDYLTPEQCATAGLVEDKQTGAVMLEIVPSGISDYRLKISTRELGEYTSGGQTLLSQLEDEQIYTVSQSQANPGASQHHFLLQRQRLTFQQLVGTLKLFSQNQNDKGNYYTSLLKIADDQAQFKAVTNVRLFETGVAGRVLLTRYQSDYFLLDETGRPVSEPTISVDHIDGLSVGLDQPARSKMFAHTGLCLQRYDPFGAR
ncbi:hypothetical protein [Salinimonas lutimaris]|uniref:hypothetical protein n=1 Tax=Salinimonas lutimaris TaxID=914153 RepID=UPI0010BFCFF9|nr:hypothetical protein [Salinimonas lutimaris]